MQRQETATSSTYHWWGCSVKQPALYQCSCDNECNPAQFAIPACMQRRFTLLASCLHSSAVERDTKMSRPREQAHGAGNHSNLRTCSKPIDQIQLQTQPHTPSPLPVLCHTPCCPHAVSKLKCRTHTDRRLPHHTTQLHIVGAAQTTGHTLCGLSNSCPQIAVNVSCQQTAAPKGSSERADASVQSHVVAGRTQHQILLLQ